MLQYWGLIPNSSPRDALELSWVQQECGRVAARVVSRFVSNASRASGQAAQNVSRVQLTIQVNYSILQ